MDLPRKYRVLFVCLGNICRSPAAEGVFRYLTEEKGLENSILADSAATSGWHSGTKADPRMRSAAGKRGYDLTSRARQVVAQDFRDFDIVLAMDRENYRDLRSMAPDEEGRRRVRYITDFARTSTMDHVPDPYYGGAESFEFVLDILEDCCAGLLEYAGKELLQKR